MNNLSLLVPTIHKIQHNKIMKWNQQAQGKPTQTNCKNKPLLIPSLINKHPFLLDNALRKLRTLATSLPQQTIMWIRRCRRLWQTQRRRWKFQVLLSTFALTFESFRQALNPGMIMQSHLFPVYH